MSKTNQQLNDVIAFWIFGLSNNFAYVIMLSAAEDIIQNEHGRNIAHNSTQQCIEDLGKPRCNELMSTGAILLADILPALCVKFTFPFFMNRIPFGFRHFVVCAFQAISYFIVAFSSSIEMSLVGVVFAAISSGLGEICFLALSSHYTKSSIAAWSSGTGGAGIIGAFLYAAMTEPKLIGLSPKTTLLCMLIVPVIFAITYWLLLTPSPTVHKMHLFVPSTWIVPAEKTALSSLRKSLSKKSEPASSTTTAKEEDSHSEVGGHEVKVYPKGDGKQLNSVSSDHEEQQSEKRAFTHEFSFRTKMRLILPILRYMIPLSLVYFGEYLINSGLHQLLPFDCARSFHLQRESQFRWYQALYQFGVFISRTSIFFLVLPRPVLYSLPLFQAANLLLLYFQALDRFIPHIVIVFLLTFIEGIFGGASYVNTFHRIHKEVPPEVREFSMSIASTGDSVGITAAGFFSILLHNHICGLYPKIYP